MGVPSSSFEAMHPKIYGGALTIAELPPTTSAIPSGSHAESM